MCFQLKTGLVTYSVFRIVTDLAAMLTFIYLRKNCMGANLLECQRNLSLGLFVSIGMIAQDILLVTGLMNVNRNNLMTWLFLNAIEYPIFTGIVTYYMYIGHMLFGLFLCAIGIWWLGWIYVYIFCKKNHSNSYQRQIDEEFTHLNSNTTTN